MNTRDKMIAVILEGDMPMVAAKMSKSGEAENVEYVPLHKAVDRLIAAGYAKNEGPKCPCGCSHIGDDVCFDPDCELMKDYQ